MTDHQHSHGEPAKPAKPPKVRGAIPGLLKGLATTARTLTRPTHTAEYPDAQPHLPPRARGVIALLEENCTSCMLCARECPDWCIYIDSHKETLPATTEGGRERQRNVLDRFAIDFSLCMYCGICIEVCPFDALHWSPEFEYSELNVLDLLHEKGRLGQWMPTVPPPPALDPASSEPPEVTAANKPPRPAPADRPARPSAVDKPARPAAAEKPAVPAPAEKPARPAAAEKHAEPLKADEPAEAAPAGKPARPAAAEKHAEPSKADEPAEAAPAGKPARPAASEKRAEPVKADEPAEAAPEDKPAGPDPEDNR